MADKRIDKSLERLVIEFDPVAASHLRESAGFEKFCDSIGEVRAVAMSVLVDPETDLGSTNYARGVLAIITAMEEALDPDVPILNTPEEIQTDGPGREPDRARSRPDYR